jgi:purine-binding chemotaxis protein CheW
MKADRLGQTTIGWQDQVLLFYLRSLLNQTFDRPEGIPAEPEKPGALTTPEPVSAAPAALPDWVRSEFQAVCFRIGRVVLAAPLAEVRRIERLDDSTKVTALPGKPDWFQGLARFQGEIIQLADTELLIGGKRAAPADGARRHALLLQGGRWGLVCGEIVDLVRLRESDVRWRANRERRAWAAGTIIDRLCVLVDPRSLIPVGRCQDKNTKALR